MLRWLPWHAPVWNTGGDEGEVVPGPVCNHVDCWDGVALCDHPLRDMLVLYFLDGASALEFLIDSHRGPSMVCRYNAGKFPGVCFANRI